MWSSMGRLALSVRDEDYCQSLNYADVSGHHSFYRIEIFSWMGPGP